MRGAGRVQLDVMSDYDCGRGTAGEMSRSGTDKKGKQINDSGLNSERRKGKILYCILENNKCDNPWG